MAGFKITHGGINGNDDPFWIDAPHPGIKFVSLAGFVGRFVFSGLSELIGCRSRRARQPGPRVRIRLPPAESQANSVPCRSAELPPDGRRRLRSVGAGPAGSGRTDRAAMSRRGLWPAVIRQRRSKRARSMRRGKPRDRNAGSTRAPRAEQALGLFGSIGLMIGLQ
jgi:hypothetical protein